MQAGVIPSEARDPRLTEVPRFARDDAEVSTRLVLQGRPSLVLNGRQGPEIAINSPQFRLAEATIRPPRHDAPRDQRTRPEPSHKLVFAPMGDTTRVWCRREIRRHEYLRWIRGELHTLAP